MVVTTPFLTEIDPRLAIRGSRDALGSQAVWGALGRMLVGNLTLSSSDVAGFRTLLIGYGLPRDDAAMPERLRLFLRWEQAAAACRIAAGDPVTPLGTQRVRRQLAERSGITISEAPEHQILEDQRASGLWVLYHRAARDSGLVDNKRRLTDAGRKLVAPWLSRLAETGPVLGKVRSGRPQPFKVTSGGKPTPDAAIVSRLLAWGTKPDRLALEGYLVRGVLPPGEAGVPRQLAGGRQERLAKLLQQRPAGEMSWRQLVPAMRDAARHSGDNDLADRLDEVLITESALYPAQAVFDSLLRDGNNSTVADFAARVKDAWLTLSTSIRSAEFRLNLQPRLVAALGAERATMWLDVADAMAKADWELALHQLIAINGHVMARRGGGPWVRTNERGVLDVRLPVGRELPEEDAVVNGWNNPYYLTPLRSLQVDLGGSAR